MSLCVCEGDEVGDGGVSVGRRPSVLRPSREMEKKTHGEVWKTVTVHVDPVAMRSRSKQPERAPMDPRRRRPHPTVKGFSYERHIL